MIVDDSELFLKHLYNTLCDDYHVMIARSGQEALNNLCDVVPDLILLDIMLPDIDGRDMIKIIKNTKETQNTPVIFLTKLNSVDDEREGLSLGASDYIVKPFDPIIVKLRVGIHIRMVNQLKRVRQLGSLDELTGLPNRRSFDERLAMLWRKAKRDGNALSLLMADIDYLKIINDTYGHLQGDEALKALAAILSGVMRRAGDYAARWGGEEFGVLLPDTDLEGALLIAEQIRSQTESTAIRRIDNEETRFTVSIGVCTHTPTQQCTTDEFIENADKALYRAKQEGRNRICHY
jgi:diguanylate cyclase (GGDEF)-like protein